MHTRSTPLTPTARAMLAVVILLGTVGPARAQRETPPSVALGRQLLEQQQFSSAAKVFRAVTTDDASNGQAWFLLGYSLHASGEYNQALPAHLKAVELGFRKATASYNAACVYAIRGEHAESLGWLEKAWANGFNNAELMRTDADLASLRGDPKSVASFTTLLSGVESSGLKRSVALGEITTLGDPMPGIGGGIVVTPDGSVLVADFLDTIYRMQPDGTRAVFATDIKTPSGIALDAEGRVYQSAFGADRVLRFSPDGAEREVLASGIPGPVGVIVAPDGRAFVTSCKSSSIYSISPHGDVERLVQDERLNCPNGLALDDAGNLYSSDFNDGMVYRVSPAGEITAVASLPGANNGHITWRHGALWVAAMQANQLYRLGLDGTLELVAGTAAPGGDDGPSLRSTLFKPNAMAFDRDGTTLYWNDQRGYRDDDASKKASIVRALVLTPPDAAGVRHLGPGARPDPASGESAPEAGGADGRSD